MNSPCAEFVTLVFLEWQSSNPWAAGTVFVASKGSVYTRPSESRAADRLLHRCGPEPSASCLPVKVGLLDSCY